MPDDQKAIYWDANVFLSYVNGTADRLPHLRALLEESGKETQIYTSTISIVEVSFGKAEQDGKALDAETEKKINYLWLSNSPVKLVEFHALIAEQAKKIMRYAISEGWKLKPMDAIHLATARSIPASEIHTYENGWDKYSSHLGINIVRPIAMQPKLI